MNHVSRKLHGWSQHACDLTNAFVAELERAQMTNEDLYSVVGELIAQQEALDGAYVMMCFQLVHAKRM